MNQDEKYAEMARRNDIARKLGLGFTLTTKAAELPDLEELLYKVRSFNDFSKKDDPHGWHDLGRLEWKGESVL